MFYQIVYKLKGFYRQPLFTTVLVATAVLPTVARAESVKHKIDNSLGVSVGKLATVSTKHGYVFGLKLWGHKNAENPPLVGLNVPGLGSVVEVDVSREEGISLHALKHSALVNALAPHDSQSNEGIEIPTAETAVASSATIAPSEVATPVVDIQYESVFVSPADVVVAGSTQTQADWTFFGDSKTEQAPKKDFKTVTDDYRKAVEAVQATKVQASSEYQKLWDEAKAKGISASSQISAYVESQDSMKVLRQQIQDQESAVRNLGQIYAEMKDQQGQERVAVYVREEQKREEQQKPVDEIRAELSVEHEKNVAEAAMKERRQVAAETKDKKVSVDDVAKARSSAHYQLTQKDGLHRIVSNLFQALKSTGLAQSDEEAYDNRYMKMFEDFQRRAEVKSSVAVARSNKLKELLDNQSSDEHKAVKAGPVQKKNTYNSHEDVLKVLAPSLYAHRFRS